MTVVIHFSLTTKTELEQTSRIQEMKGKLASQMNEQKLMHSVLQNDKKLINDGKIIQEALNRGISSFTPDIMFERIVKNYSMTTQLFGETLIQLLLDCDTAGLQRNLRLPEFARELKKKIEQKITDLKEKELLDDEGFISQKGIELASIIMYVEELETLQAKGLIGTGKTKSHYGEKNTIRDFKQGDSFKTVAIRASIKTAIKRGHEKLKKEDLKTSTKVSQGKLSIIYGIDSSASMKGKKLELCKKAGIALAYKAIANNDKVGIVSFASNIKDSISPTKDFITVIQSITKIKASDQTDFHKAIDKTIEIFTKDKTTKHLLLLTDALPTVGTQPEKDTLNAVHQASDNGITTSVVGIQLDEKGIKLAKEIALAGRGRFFTVKDIEELDRIVLEDYYALQSEN